MMPPEPSDPEPKSERPPSRWRGRLAVVLVVALALGAVLRALLPLGLERALESQLADALGRPVRVANVDLALLRGGIVLDGVVIGAPGAAAPTEGNDEALLRAERLLVRVAWSELVRGRLHLRRIALDGTTLRLARAEDGRLEPLAFGGEGPARAEDEASAQGWPLHVDRIVVREGRLRVVDPASESAPLDLRLPELTLAHLALETEGWTLGALEARAPTLRLHRDGSPAARDEAPAANDAGDQPRMALRAGRVAIQEGRLVLLGDDEPLEVTLQFSASEVSTGSEARFPIELALGVGEGRAELKGSAGVLPLAFQGRLELSDLPLAPLVHAAAGPAGQPLRAGRASGALDLTAEPAEGASERWLRASGRLAVDALAVADRASGSFGLGWKRLEATLAEARLPLGGGGAARLDLERLRVELPSLRWVRTPPAPAAGEATAESEGATAPMQVAIAELELVDGSVDFEDRSVEPAFRARAEQVAATARDVAWPERRAQAFRVSGQVLERGSLALNGELGAEKGSLELELAGVGLPPLNPYVSRAGYRFGAGQASLRSELELDGTRIEASNQLLLRDLDVESSGEGWLEQNLGLSLGLAVALLRDPAGAIRLAVPLTWEAGAGGAGFGGAFQSALRQALVGAVSTPLKLVGATFSVRGAEVVRFEALGSVAGEPILTESGEARLASLLALLETRPRLGVRLRGRSGPSDDAALAVAGEGVAAGPREALARARAERIAERLAERGIEARRVELGSPTPPGAPGVDVEFFALAS